MGLRILVGTAVLGAVLFFMGFQDWRLATKAQGNPQIITAAQLEANGPGNNAHIILSDFQMCEWSFVYETEGRNKEKWKWVWLPVVPLDSPYVQQLQAMAQAGQQNAPPPPDHVRIIVKSNKAASEAGVHNMAMANTLQGMVINEIESLGGEERRLLSESYPGIDFSNCWIVQADRKPAGSAQVMALMGAGGTLVLAAASFFAGQWKS
jgi:hypothetical protein